MANFPNIRRPSSIEETSTDPAIKTEFESGIVQSRARYTRIRRTLELSWNALTNSDYQALRAFYNSQHGGAIIFTWINPQDSNSYSVRFSGDLKAKNFERDYWSLTLTLEEA